HGSFGSSASSFAPFYLFKVSRNRKAPGNYRGRGRRSALVLLLPPFVPLLQQLEDLLLHSLGRVALGEIFAQRLGGKGYFVQVGLFLLAHNGAHDIQGQVSLLAEFLQALGLGERRRG